MRDPEAARTTALADADQDVAVRSQRRLHDGVACPCVLPEQLAVGETDADQTGLAQEKDLRHSVYCREMRRAVTHAPGRAGPALGTSRQVVGNELPGGATTTRSLITSGELAKPHIGIAMPVSDAALRDHTTEPSRSLSAFTIPVAP